MYAHVVTLKSSLGKMPQIRQMINEQLLPALHNYEGFIGGYLLEQIDDPDSAQLIQFWESQSALEKVHRTGMLKTSLASLIAYFPGLQMKQQGYIVRARSYELPTA